MDQELLKLYELNEKYHDSKEKMAWLSATLYLSFTTLSFKWLAENKRLVINNPVYYFLFFTVVFFCAAIFFCYQASRKWKSVEKTSRILQAIYSNRINIVEKEEFQSIYRDEIKLESKGKCCEKLSIRKMEIVLLLLMAVFWVGQSLFICNFDNEYGIKQLFRMVDWPLVVAVLVLIIVCGYCWRTGKTNV